MSRPESISITGRHNSEAGLDAHDSGNEQQQRAISFAMTTINTLNVEKSLENFRSADNPRIQNPYFQFFPQENSYSLSSTLDQPSFNLYNDFINLVGRAADVHHPNNTPF